MRHIAHPGSSLECYREIIRVGIGLHAYQGGVLGFPVLQQISQGLRFVFGRTIDPRLVGGVNAMATLAGADFARLISEPIAFFGNALVVSAEQLVSHGPAGGDKGCE